MSHVRSFDHVGLTVADLDVVTAFFVALGLELEGRTGDAVEAAGLRAQLVGVAPPSMTRLIDARRDDVLRTAASHAVVSPAAGPRNVCGQRTNVCGRRAKRTQSWSSSTPCWKLYW